MSNENWTPESWNTCPKCKGPVEKAGGDVDFADGDEAKCTNCGTVLMVSIAENGGPCSVYEPDADDGLHMFDVYGGEEEVIIAKDADDARVFMLTMVKPEDLEDAVFDEYDDDAEYTCRDEPGEPVTKTVREWCTQFGRGYFASCYA